MVGFAINFVTSNISRAPIADTNACVKLIFSACRPCRGDYLIFLILFLTSTVSVAGSVLEATVSHQQKTYTVRIAMDIAAPRESVYKLLTDYNNLSSINPAILESRVISSPHAALHRVYTLTRACVLFFCVKLVQVQDVQEVNEHEILATIIGRYSDFEHGTARWKLRDKAGLTQVFFQAQLQPSFWIPPVIGPWLIKHKLREEALESVLNLERLASVGAKETLNKSIPGSSPGQALDFSEYEKQKCHFCFSSFSMPYGH